MQIKPKQKGPAMGPQVSGATKRKWSDWSECTINCVKVRHRFNCDDIVGEEQKQLTNTTTKTNQVTNNSKQQSLLSKAATQLLSTDNNKLTNDESAKKSTIIKKRTTSKLEEESLLSVRGLEDDYADDGDEIEPDDEESTDLCDKVDTSKTFEEIPCLGGLCRLPLTQQGAINLMNQVTPATTTPSPSLVAPSSITVNHNRHHHRLQHRKPDSNPPKASLSQNDLEVDNNHQQHHTSRLSHIAASSQQPDTTPVINNRRQPTFTHNHNHNHHHSQHQHEHSAEIIGGGNLNSLVSQEAPPSETPFLPASGNMGQPSTATATFSSSSSSSSQQQQQPATIWSRAIWPTKQLLLNSASSGEAGAVELPPHIILIQWAILVGILLAIILLLVILIKKLVSSPSYHWMLAKQMIKSTSSRLGPTPNNITTSVTTNSTLLEHNDDNNNNNSPSCYRLAPPHHKGYATNNNSLVFNSPFNCGNALLLAESSPNNNHSPASSNNIKTQICYGCHHDARHHHQQQQKTNLNRNLLAKTANCIGLIDCPVQLQQGNETSTTTTTTTNTSSSLNNLNGANAIHCVVDSNGRHANIASFMNSGGRFNTDQQHIVPASNNYSHQIDQPPSYIYASMTRQSSDLSQNFDNNMQQQFNDATNLNISNSRLSDYNNNNYDTLNNNYSNSLGYDDPANLIPERDKAFILTRDFVVLPMAKSNNQLASNNAKNDDDSTRANMVEGPTTNDTQSVDRLASRGGAKVAAPAAKAIVAPTVVKLNNEDKSKTDNL